VRAAVKPVRASRVKPDGDPLEIPGLNQRSWAAHPHSGKVIRRSTMPTVPIDDTRLYYEERGSGSPVLLIHGTGGHTGTFNAVSQRLASSHRVISYDRRGFTRSEAPPPAKKAYLRRHADDAALLLRELGAPRATVVGWSMGAVVALALAVHHPDAVSQLVLYEPPLHAKKHMGLRVARALGGAILLGKLGRHRRGAARFYRFALGYKKGGNAFDELDPEVRESVLANSRTTIAELEAGTGEELSRDELARIKCPVGIIVGDRSASFLQAAAARSAEIFPRARTVRVPDGDHVMNVRQPEAFARAIQELTATA
jgi:pimeloyl-ACP methyl ester carboxylesterase